MAQTSIWTDTPDHFTPRRGVINAYLSPLVTYVFLGPLHGDDLSPLVTYVFLGPLHGDDLSPLVTYVVTNIATDLSPLHGDVCNH